MNPMLEALQEYKFISGGTYLASVFDDIRYDDDDSDTYLIEGGYTVGPNDITHKLDEVDQLLTDLIKSVDVEQLDYNAIVIPINDGAKNLKSILRSIEL